MPQLLSPFDYTFEPATFEDVDRVWEIIQQAQAIMKANGSTQWQNGYPNPESIRKDITNDTAFVIRIDNDVAAYGSVSFDGEPAYHPMTEGKWLNDDKYVVLHRLAIANEHKQRGLASIYLQEVEKLAVKRGVFSFRVDTIEDNLAMRNCLAKFGFVYTGQCEYNKNPRMCFEKHFHE